MDEVIFRSSQKIENLQVQLGLAASKSKDILHEYSKQSKSLVLGAWHHSKMENARRIVKDAFRLFVAYTQDLQYRLSYHLNPRRLWLYLARALPGRWTSRDLCFCCAGFICGGLFGIAVGIAMRRKETVIRYMQAIQCSHYLGIESATVVEDAIAPYECNENEILVNVKAASVQIIDSHITSGYGRTYRDILRRLHHSSTGLPVILGRDCSGVVTDIGKNVTRIEVGDEVWLTVPFWSQGTLSQTVLVPENRASKKPKNIGFEGACSLPYAGCIALSAIKQAEILFENAQEQRILIYGGCTPVGCILIQILKHWGADVTTTCNRRALPVAKALGADDVIALPDDLLEGDITPLDIMANALKENRRLTKELEVRDKFDVVIITQKSDLDMKDFYNFCKANDCVVSTLPRVLCTDRCGYFGGVCVSFYVYIQFLLEKMTGLPFTNLDEAHMCYAALDELTNLVESGHLQTVVDKVFQPQDIEIALNHINSPQSIGSTVITFR